MLSQKSNNKIIKQITLPSFDNDDDEYFKTKQFKWMENQLNIIKSKCQSKMSQTQSLEFFVYIHMLIQIHTQRNWWLVALMIRYFDDQFITINLTTK